MEITEADLTLLNDVINEGLAHNVGIKEWADGYKKGLSKPQRIWAEIQDIVRSTEPFVSPKKEEKKTWPKQKKKQ